MPRCGAGNRKRAVLRSSPRAHALALRMRFCCHRGAPHRSSTASRGNAAPRSDPSMAGLCGARACRGADQLACRGGSQAVAHTSCPAFSRVSGRLPRALQLRTRISPLCTSRRVCKRSQLYPDPSRTMVRDTTSDTIASGGNEKSAQCVSTFSGRSPRSSTLCAVVPQPPVSSRTVLHAVYTVHCNKKYARTRAAVDCS